MLPSSIFKLAVLASLLMAGCTVQTRQAEQSLGMGATAPGLTCEITSNCVNSLENSELKPLTVDGTPEQRMALLRRTLAFFPEAQVIQSSPTWLKAIFTTPLGFRDEVVFVLNAQTAQIHFRSKSLLGLYDFGKNASRMRAFTAQFDSSKN